MRLASILLTLSAINGLAGDKAAFTKDGQLVFPADYRQWVFLSSGLGMTYGPSAPAPGAPLRFDNVYVNPSSYRQFLRTGKWTDGTILILEVRESESKGSINQHGHFQGKLVAIEANVKDSKRFDSGGWAFFELMSRGEPRQTAKPFPPGNGCAQCHSPHGAVDNTFVQFYPELKPVAIKFRTFRATSADSGSAH